MTDPPKVTKRTGALHLLLQSLYLTLRAPLKPSHASYSPTTSVQPTNLQLRYDTCWQTLQTGTNLPYNRQGAVYKINSSDCQASYIVETGRNLNTRLTEHKRATRNGDALNNHIALHHQLTNHNIDWDTAQCLTYITNYFQRLTLESWYRANLEQTPLNRCQPLLAPL